MSGLSLPLDRSFQGPKNGLRRGPVIYPSERLPKPLLSDIDLGTKLTLLRMGSKVVTDLPLKRGDVATAAISCSVEYYPNGMSEQLAYGQKRLCLRNSKVQVP